MTKKKPGRGRGRPKEYATSRKIVSLRLEPGLYNALKEAAVWNRRTLQQEMQFILEHRLSVDGFIDGDGQAFADLDLDLKLHE